MKKKDGRKRRTLVVMTKEPRAGRVKTRLGQDIGMIPATWWFRHQTRRLLLRLHDPRWQLVLAISPDRARGSRCWPPHVPRVPQGLGDLGMRMKRMLQTSAATGPVCVIGGDIPGITGEHIARAFSALGHSDVVFGPAVDGGYWLVGAKHPNRLPATTFRHVRWSSQYALSDSICSLPGQEISLVDQLADIDTGADLHRLQTG